MRVLVTGISGQVGGALMSVTAPAGITLIGAGRDKLDLSRPGSIAEAVSAMAPDIVVNPAAYTAVDQAETERDLAIVVNRDGPAALAEICGTLGIGLIHLSTDYVFDGSGARPYLPNDPIAPLGVYGASKEAGEAAIRDRLEDHLILRTAWVYAVDGKNFVNTMLRVGAQRDELKVVADQHGTPTAAEDIAAAILAILSARSAGSGVSGTHHYTASGATTWHGLAEAVFARAEPVWGRRPAVQAIPSSEYPTPAARPAYSVLDNSSLDNAVAVPRRDWRAAAEATVDLILQRT
ncbi:MAG: dTDP-4-dehydrorhamnose reductase [Alphaproteobacteria bacterium]|nr:dTDP-4-dehydrorhamnose reductase [Alphaproteobacteria bacterium]